MRSWLLRLLAVALVVGLPPALRTERALACSCMDLDPQEAYSNFDGVFVGRAVRVHEVPFEESDPWFRDSVTEFKVATVWKGALYEVLWTRSGWPSACGIRFVEGEDYLVYVSDWRPDDWGTLVAAGCGYSRPLAVGGAFLEALGEGQAPEPGLVGPRPARLETGLTLPVWAIGAVVAGVVALSALGFLALRHRARPT